MSEAAGNPPDASSPYGKRGGSKTTMYIVVAVMLVVGLLVGGVIGAALATPKDVGSKDRLRAILDRGELIVASDTTWAPFEIQNATTKAYEGVDIEIVQRIADDLGVKLTIRPMGFDAVLTAPQTGQADISISSITITPERAMTVDFSDSYYEANQAILVKTTSSISNIGDLNGKKVGTQIDTTGADWVTEHLVNTGNITSSNAIQYNDIPSAAAALDQGIIDAVICDTPVAINYATNTHFSFKVAYTIITNEEYGIEVQKGNPLLMQFINASLAGMKDDGTLHAILVKWKCA